MQVNKNKAVLYCRLSKEDHDKLSDGDESASIKNQRLLLTDFALDNGFEVIDVYQDDDYSGLFSNRPDFERLIEDAKLQKFQIIIAKSQSRFTRNMEHMEKYLHNTFPLLGIRFIGVADHADTANKGNKKSRQINGLVNEWYCEDLSENIRSVFTAKMKQGQFLGSSCPYGYVKDPKDHNHLIIDEYAANVVRKIFKLYIKGYGKAKIGSILTSEGILIPSKYKVEILGQNYHNANVKATTNVWSYQTIHQILNNETYIGNIAQNKHKTLSYKSKKKVCVPKEEWIRKENMHNPIISKDIWEITRTIQKEKTKSVNTKSIVDIFSGKLYCADCDKNMVRYYNRKGIHIGYCCKTYKAHGNKFCTSHFISNEKIKELVIELIRNEAKKALEFEKAEDIEDIVKQGIADNENHNTIQTIEILENKLRTIQNYKKKTYENFVDEILTKKEYLDYKNKYAEEEQILDKQILKLNEQSKRISNLDNKHKEWVDKLKNYYGIQKLEREDVVNLINCIKINSNNELDIALNFKSPYA